MITQHLKLVIPLTVALACGSAAVSAAPLVLGDDLNSLTVFSNTYTTTGANSSVYGNVLSGGVSTTGTNAAVTGNLVSVGAANVGGGTSTVGGDVTSNGVMMVGGAVTALNGPIVSGSITSTGDSTIGAYATVGGDMLSGGAATTDANANVLGNLWSGGAATVGANSTVSGNLTSTSGPITISASGNVGGTQATGGAMPTLSGVRTSVSSESTQVTNAQNLLSGLGSGTALAAVPFSMTLAPGVYSAASLSMAAGNTFTLDGQGQEDPFWVFNIKDILAPGDDTVVSLINAGDNASVFWNVSDGYASIGDNSTFIGTIFADNYISVGASTTVSGLGSSCGGIFSATSYVSTGDGASIGGIGCSGVNVTSVTSAVPEPQMFGLMLTGLGVLGFVTRRRAQAKRA